MIGFECLWCDQQVTFHPDALAAGSITCPACLTQVDLVVGPVAAASPVRSPGTGMDLPLAA
jgi:hypothetical protein